MRKESGSAPAASLWEWPIVGYVLVLAIALPVLVEETVDIAALLFGNAMPSLRYYGTLSTYWLQLPAIALSIFFLSRFGRNGMLAAALGAISSLLIVINFRSGFIRPGTFDFFEEQAPWKLPFYLGVAIGCAAAILLAPKCAPNMRFVRQATLTASIGIAIVAAVAAWTCAVNPTVSWSEFAPTRHIVLSGMALVCIAVFAFANWSEKSNEEEYRLHAN